MTTTQRIARIDARGWFSRNRHAAVLDQVVKNHYSMSRDKGYLGAVSRVCLGLAWEEYQTEFLAEIARQQTKEVNNVPKRNAASSGV